MKHVRIIALLLAVSVLHGCTAKTETPTIPETQATETLPVEMIDPILQQEEKTDYSDLVFDTDQDPETLTARYLYMNKTMGTGSDYVYSGDASVYTSPDGYVMLVDTSNQISGPDVIAQLKKMGIEKIDILVLSHPHADHVGGFCQIAEAFPISQVYTNGHDYDTATYQNCVAKMNELNIPCSSLAAGDTFAFGQQVQVAIYGPQPGENEEVAAGYQDANDGSVAMRITFGESSFWTSGDLYISGEEAITELYGEDIRSDVVKLNHHGKDTSNGRNFVKHIGCLIAVGMNDNVGSLTVARRFAAAGAQVFYNSCDGAIRIRTTGDGTYQVQTQFLRELDALPPPSENGSYTVIRP